MSADNGIYILETKGPEYRVRELQAIENVSWDESTGGDTSDQDVIISNARRMWRDCKMTEDRTEALAEADRLLYKAYICEYGISFIKVDRKF